MIDTLDRFIATLARVRSAENASFKRREKVLSDAFATLASLYGELDRSSPEVCSHLGAVYDGCLEAIGEAYTGRFARIAQAESFFRAYRAALAGPEIEERVSLAG